MLADGHVGEPVLAAAGLDLEKGEQGPDLLLNRFETYQLIEFGLDLWKRPRRIGTCWQARTPKPLPQQLLGVASGCVASFEQALTDFIRSKDAYEASSGQVVRCSLSSSAFV